MSEPSTAGRVEPFLVLVTGYVASGKSTVSRLLAARLGAERLEADRVRGTLLESVEREASGAEARWRRDLSPGFEDEIYADLLERADALLAAGRPLVLDACFPRRRQREAARALARRHGVPFLHVECVVPDATLRARLEARDRAAGRAGWVEIQRSLAAHFEPVEAPDAGEHVVVESDGDTQIAIDAVLARLRTAVRLPAGGSGPRVSRMPRVVSFDCWGTLLAEEDWPWAHALRVRALADAVREAGVELEPAAISRAFDEAWGRHMRLWEEERASGAREVARWALGALGLEDALPALEHLVHRFEEASHTSRVVALDGAPALLHALQNAGVRCVLVCDTGLTPGRVVRRLLDRVGLLERLDRLAFSDEVGVPKPDGRAFRAALDPLGIAPEEALHVGDLRRTDVAGARALGMQSVRIRARNDDVCELADADYVVDSHTELAALLGVPLVG